MKHRSHPRQGPAQTRWIPAWALGLVLLGALALLPACSAARAGEPPTDELPPDDPGDRDLGDGAGDERLGR